MTPTTPRSRATRTPSSAKSPPADGRAPTLPRRVSEPKRTHVGFNSDHRMRNVTRVNMTSCPSPAAICVRGSACDAGRVAAPNAGQPLLAVPRRAHLASDGGSATSGRDDEDAKRVAGEVGINPERLLLVVGAVHEHLGAQGQGALVGRVQLSPVGHG